MIYVPNFVKLLSIEAEPDHKTDALVSVNVGFQSTFWWWSSTHRYPLECQGASLLIAGNKHFKPNTCCEKINLSPPLMFGISPTAVQLAQKIETNRLAYRSLLVLNLLGSYPWRKRTVLECELQQNIDIMYTAIKLSRRLYLIRQEREGELSCRIY